MKILGGVFEDIEFLRFGGEFFLFFVVEGSRSGNLPVLVEQRLGGIFRFEVRFSGGLVWKSSRMGWRSKFGGAVVIFWRSKYLEELWFFNEIGFVFGAVQLGGVVTHGVTWSGLGMM